MLDCRTLLSSLSQKGVRIWEDNGELRYQAPTAFLHSEEFRELVRVKDEVLAILRQPIPRLHSPIRPRQPGRRVPLTAHQHLLWKHRHPPGNEMPFYLPNCVTSVHVLGALDTSLLRQCIGVVVERHEALRTRIVTVNGIPEQYISASADYSFQIVDISRVDRERRHNEVNNLGQQFVQEMVDESIGPLFRTMLLRLTDAEHVLFCATDHLVSDGSTKRIVHREIWTLYDRSLQGLPLLLDEVSLQFADYAVWQEDTYQEWLQEHESYWRQTLRGAPRLEPPVNIAGRWLDADDISVQRFPFGERTTRDLRTLAQRERTLLSVVVLSAYILAISRWCNEKDVVVAVVSDGRLRPELEQTAGFITSPLPMRVQILDTDNLLQVLKRTERAFYAACDHYDYNRVQALIPELFTPVAFNWMPDNVEWSPIWHWAEQIAVVTLRPYPFVQSAPFHFFPLFYYTDTDIILTVQYCRESVSDEAADHFARHVLAFTQKLSRNPDRSVACAMNEDL